MNSWGNAVDSANYAFASSDGNVTYRNPVSINSLGQLIITNFGNPNAIHHAPQKENFSDPVVIYPNPSARGGSIVLKSVLQEEMTVLIYDEEGKEIINKRFFHSLEIPSSAFSSGIYFYSVRSDRQMQNGKFVVE